MGARANAAIGATAGLAIGAAGTVYLVNASGGSVEQYAQTFDRLHNEDKKVVIKGDCASSCTMMLGYSNMCLDEGASLRFHPGYNSFGVFWVVNPAANQLMLAHYPPEARRVIDAHGNLTNQVWGWGAYPPLFTIKATEFPSHLCA